MLKLMIKVLVIVLSVYFLASIIGSRNIEDGDTYQGDEFKTHLPAFYFSVLPGWYDARLSLYPAGPVKKQGIDFLKNGLTYNDWLKFRALVDTISGRPQYKNWNELKYIHLISEINSRIRMESKNAAPDEFLQKIAAQEFLEWEEVYPGTFYGTLRSEIDRIWNRGNNVIFDVDVEGGLNIKRHFNHQAMLVFVMPPSLEVLTERLRNRATENEKSFEMRVKKAEREMEYSVHADKILINDKLEDTLPEAIRIVKEFLQEGES